MTDAACGDSKERSAEYYYQVYNEINNIVQLNNSDHCYQVYYEINNLIQTDNASNYYQVITLIINK